MKRKRLYLILLVVSLEAFKLSAQTAELLDYFPEIIITESNNPSPGYFLIATKKYSDGNGSNYVAIVDNYGTPVYFRLQDGIAASISTKLKDHIIYNEGVPKQFHVFDSMFRVVDTLVTDGYKLDGHDFDMDANGHVLLLGNERVTMDMTQYGGPPDATIRDKVVQEFDENQNLLYTWKALEHFDITDANEESPFVDLTANTIDYLHANSLAFDSDTSFLLLCRHFDEITKIDRRTGDIIWRLGGKNNQFNFINDTLKFSHPHTIRKLSDGSIMLFDNGNLHAPQFSSVVIYELDEINKTATLIRRQRHDPEVYAGHSGGEQMLENGNLLVYWGEKSPSFTEYHPDGSVALEMDFSQHSFSNRIAKSDFNHKVFVTSTDSVYYGMWDGYTESPYLLTLHNNTDSVLKITSYSTHTDHFTVEEILPVEIPAGGETILTLIYFPQTAQTGFIQDILTLNSEYPDILIARQVVLQGSKEDNQHPTAIIMPDSSNVPVNAIISITFSEPVRNLDNTELDYKNIDDLFIFKKNDINGADIPYDAIVNTEKTQIEIIPLDSLDDDQVYYIFVDAVFEDYSDNVITPSEVTFSTGSFVDVSSLPADNNFRVYPNPGRGGFLIDFPDQSPKIIEVYSLTGILIYQSDLVRQRQYTIDLSDQSPGLYMLIFKSQDKQLLGSEKIIIQK